MKSILLAFSLLFICQSEVKYKDKSIAEWRLDLRTPPPASGPRANYESELYHTPTLQMVPLLIELAKDKDINVKVPALECIENMLPCIELPAESAEALSPYLIDYLSDKEEILRSWSTILLREITPKLGAKTKERALLIVRKEIQAAKDKDILRDLKILKLTLDAPDVNMKELAEVAEEIDSTFRKKHYLSSLGDVYQQLESLCKIPHKEVDKLLEKLLLNVESDNEYAAAILDAIAVRKVASPEVVEAIKKKMLSKNRGRSRHNYKNGLPLFFNIQTSVHTAARIAIGALSQFEN